jgi:hypothetical protein
MPATIRIAPEPPHGASRTGQYRNPSHSASRTLVGAVFISIATAAVAAEDRSDGAIDRPNDWPREHKTLALNATIVGAVTLYGFTLWDWGGAQFSARNEGWFGRDTRHGGADKLGHAYTGSVATALSAALYRHWGYDEAHAARLGVFSGLLLTTAVELGDGFSPDHKFSWEDQVSNMAGVGFEYLRLRHPWLRDRVHFRWEYFPSPAVRHGRHNDITTDYSGSRWLLAFPLRTWGFGDSRLRWIELQVGYGTRGFARRDRDFFDEARRHPFVGVGIHIPLVLESFGVGAAPRRVFEHLQIPGTALPLPP